MAASAPKPPLAGIRVLELAGLAPTPFTGLLLADFGASVIRIDRPSPTSTSSPTVPTSDLLTRHKASVVLDLKSASSVTLLKALLPHVDILIDPYRPGVLESLHLSLSALLALNPRLIIARLSGFRRDGPYTARAGHDINYLAVSGVLSQLGPPAPSPPAPPGNILADFAGGGLMCACGILMALLARQTTGRGQVVEANMVDGAAYLGTFARLARKTGLWDRDRGRNLLDGGAPFYGVYACKGGGYMAVGALEPKFFRKLVEGLGLVEEWGGRQYEREGWEQMRAAFEERFAVRTRGDWEEVFGGVDACCTPVLELGEMEEQGHQQRGAVLLSESPGLVTTQEEAWVSRGLVPGEGGEKVLEEWVGWKRGRDFDIEDGALVSRDKAKL